MQMKASTAEKKKKLFTRNLEKSKKKQVEVSRADQNEEESKKYLFEHVEKKEEANGLRMSLKVKAEREHQEQSQGEEKFQEPPCKLFQHITSEAVQKAVQRDMEKSTLNLNHNSQQKVRTEDKMQKITTQSQQPCKGNSPVKVRNVETSISEKGIPSASLQPTVKGKRKSWENLDSINFTFADNKLCGIGTDGIVGFVGNFCLQILEEKEKRWEKVNEAREVTGIISKRFWRLKILMAGREYEGEVQSERLFEFGWIRDISQERAILYDSKGAKRLFKIYIQKLIHQEQHSKIVEYDSAGWKWLNNGEICYLTSQGAIGHCSIPVRAVRGFDMLTVPKSSHQILREFLGMRNIIPGNLKNAVLLQNYLLAAQMTALFKKIGCQIEFSVALIGKTNTKKTSCGEVFTRVFNRTQSAVPEINFSATETAIYEIMDRFADTVVMVDDLTPFENDADANEKRKKLESIIRAYGDRVPKKRSVSFAKNSAAREFSPISGCALLTGETFSGGKSSRSRVVILNFEEEDVDNSVLSYYQKNLHILPNLIEKFLYYVAERVENVMGIISYECEEARRIVGKSLKIPRYADAYGVFCAASRIFFEYIVGEGLMNVSAAQELLASDRNLIFQVIAENDSAVTNIAPGIMVVEALKEAIKKGFISVKETYLMRDGEFLYITSENLWECAKRYTDYHRMYFPYRTGRELIEPLKAENLILTKQEGEKSRSSHKIVLNGRLINRRFLYLHKEKVEKIWEELENY